MASDLPKVLHTIDGRPMVRYVIESVKQVGPDKVILVVGYQGQRVVDACADAGVEFVWQREQLGTGHAVMQAEAALDGFAGTVIVLNGDVPCLTPATLNAFIAYHDSQGASATVLTARMADPTGYGRVVRAPDGALHRIVEQKDASADELEIDEVNSGLFCFDARMLFSTLQRTDTRNAQNEYYLPDAIEMLAEAGERVAAWCIEDNQEVAGVNTVDELESIRRYLGAERG